MDIKWLLRRESRRILELKSFDEIPVNTAVKLSSPTGKGAVYIKVKIKSRHSCPIYGLYEIQTGKIFIEPSKNLYEIVPVTISIREKKPELYKTKRVSGEPKKI